MKIYELSVKTVNLPLKKDTGFLEVNENTGYGKNLFSTYDKAYKEMERVIKELDSEEELFAYSSIIERSVDEESEFVDGDFHFFKIYQDKITNVKNIPNDLKEGDWVIYVQGDSIDCGIVGGISIEQDEEDSPLYVINESNQKNDCSPHSHLSLYNVVKVVQEQEAKDFLPTKYYENIKKRYLLIALGVDTYNMTVKDLVKKHKK